MYKQNNTYKKSLDHINHNYLIKLANRSQFIIHYHCSITQLHNEQVQIIGLVLLFHRNFNISYLIHLDL